METKPIVKFELPREALFEILAFQLFALADFRRAAALEAEQEGKAAEAANLRRKADDDELSANRMLEMMVKPPTVWKCRFQNACEIGTKE